MANILEVAKKIKGTSCERLVKYTGQEYVISGGKFGLGTFKLDIASFQNKIKEINAVPPIMMALDNNQYLLCQQASQLTNDSKLKEDCIRIRLMQIMSFTQLQALLSVPPSEEVNQQIAEWIKNMTKLTQSSIELLNPKPRTMRIKAKLRPERTEKSSGTEPSETRVYATLPSVKAEITAIMKYQGIKATEMRNAIDILSK